MATYDLPAPPAPTRPRTLMVGTALAVVAGAALIGAMLAIYLNARDAAGGTTASWLPPEVAIRQVAATVGTITLFFSGVTMQWAVYAIARDDRRASYAALGMTVVLGFAFINSMAYELRTMGLDLRADDYSLLVLGIVGTQMALVLVAIAFTGLMAFRTLGGRYSARDTEGLAAAALFWHFTVVASVAVWACVFALQ